MSLSLVLSLSDERDAYIPNPTKNILGIKKHPLRWPRQVLTAMGIPETPPIVPIAPTSISNFPQSFEASGRIYMVARSLSFPKLNRIPFNYLRTFVATSVDWYQGSRGVNVATTEIDLIFQIGGQAHLLSSIRVIFCRSAIFVAYVDAPFRSKLRKHFAHANSREFERLSANAQKDDALDPYDFALLIALAQDQKFGGVRPEGGVYTTRVFYPSSTCDQMIFLTARVPDETLLALENKESQVRKVEVSMFTTPLGSYEEWTESGFLRTLVTVADECLAAANTIIKPEKPESIDECNSEGGDSE